LVHPLLEIALLPVAYAVLLLLTLQLFRFAGGAAAAASMLAHRTQSTYYHTVQPSSTFTSTRMS
jgi:hypothetical protein